MSAFITKSVLEVFDVLECGTCSHLEIPGWNPEEPYNQCPMCHGHGHIQIPDEFVESVLIPADKVKGAFDNWTSYPGETWSVIDFYREGIIEVLALNTIDIEFEYWALNDGEDGYDIMEVTLTDHANTLGEILLDDKTRELFISKFKKEFQEVAADHWAEIKLEMQYPTD